MPQTVKSNNNSITLRIMIVFVMTFVVILGITQIYGLLVRSDSYRETLDALGVAAIVFGALALCLAAFSAVLTVRKHLRTRLFWSVTLLAAILCVICWSLNRFYIDAVRVLNIVLCGMAVLYLVYRIFQREFFVQALMLAGYAAGFWTACQYFERANMLAGCLCGLLMAVVLLLVALLALPRLRKNGGTLRLFGRDFAISRPRADYTVPRVTLCVLAAGMIALAVCTLIGPFVAGRASIYVMLTTLGYLFILAVYYTVKLVGE